MIRKLSKPRTPVRILAFTLVIGLVLAGGCDAESPERPASPDPVVITSEGVGCARIGDPASAVREACDVVTDTVLLLEGMEQQALVARVGGADVLAEIVEGRAWRLSVLGAGPLTQDSVGVGTSFDTVAARLDVDVHAGEGRYFAVPVAPCGISFELEGVPFGGVVPSAEALQGRGSEVRVSRVLVLGC